MLLKTAVLRQPPKQMKTESLDIRCRWLCTRVCILQPSLLSPFVLSAGLDKANPCYSKCGPWPSRICIIQELVINAEPWAPSQTCGSHLHSNKICSNASAYESDEIGQARRSAASGLHGIPEAAGYPGETESGSQGDDPERDPGKRNPFIYSNGLC